ncbi:DNA mismatch repair protein, partial [Archaeoglobales archaeon ex4484_92]
MKLNPEAKAIYKGIRDEIKSRIQLKESLVYLEKFSPTNNKEEIIGRQKYLKKNLPKIRPELKEFLAKIRPIRFRRDYLHDRLLVVDDSELEKARALEVCDVSSEPLDGYTIILGTIGYGIDVSLSIAEIAPELYILPLWENKDVLKALSNIKALLGEDSVSNEILVHLREIENVMKKRKLLSELDEIVREEEKRLNERIEELLKEFSLTLSGKDLLDFLKKLKEGDYESIFSHFSQVENKILEEMVKSEERLSNLLEIDVEIFSRESLYPVEVPTERIEAMGSELEREIKMEIYLKSREVLRKIRPLIPQLREELKRAYELEFLRAVSEFTQGFTFPELIDGGIGFINGRHLFIRNPQPVSYAVGEVAHLNG